ncbi:MAG TPA: phosphate ABC transporter ATP-binding protein PstB [Caulobacteraceae bacterium]|nr:phosphate ABC transporter ATP-binding protein PstB [Caulobacteraceae bacterium]
MNGRGFDRAREDVAAPGTVDGEAPARPIRLQVNNLDFFYGRHQALKDVNVGFPAAGISAIIGPSGCGKSTLLRAMNRIYALYPGQRASGEILLDGENVLAPSYDVGRLRAQIGMVFQKATPFHLSIFENIAFPLRHYERLSRAQQSERVEKALRQAALWDEVKDQLGRSALALSGGQQQRLCIARTLAVRPEVVLMDEPTSALDPISTARIEELLAQLSLDFKVIIVTHNLQQAARVASHVVFMFEGAMVEEGSHEQIFLSPKQQKTSDYVTGRFG